MKNSLIIILFLITTSLFGQPNLTFKNSMRLGSTNFHKGQTVSVSGKVFNAGNQTARGANILFILARSPKPTENDYLLEAVGNSSFSAVSRSRSTAVSTRTRLPSNLQNGTYYLFPVINPSGNKETTYRDNWQRFKITVGASNSSNNSSSSGGSNASNNSSSNSGNNSSSNSGNANPTLSSSCPCIIYSDRNYRGKAACLKVGRTVARNTSVGDNNMESYKVMNGYTLIMRDGINYNGTQSSGTRSTTAESKLRNRVSSFILTKNSSSSSSSSSTSSFQKSAFTANNVSGSNGDACSKVYSHPSISKGRYGRAWVDYIHKVNGIDQAIIKIVSCQSREGMCGDYEIRRDRIDGPVVAKAWIGCSGSKGTSSGAKVKITGATRLFAVLVRKTDNKRYFLGEMEICLPGKCPPKMSKNYYQGTGNSGKIIANLGRKGTTANGIQVGITNPKKSRLIRGNLNTTFEIRNYTRQDIQRYQLKVDYYSSADMKFSTDDKLVATDNRVSTVRGNREQAVYQQIPERSIPSNAKYILAVVREGNKAICMSVTYYK